MGTGIEQRARIVPTQAEPRRALPWDKVLHELQSLTAALAAVEDSQAVSDAVLRYAVTVTGALACSVSLLEPDGRTLDLVGCTGPLPAQTTFWASYALDADLPAAHATRTGETIYLSGPEELAAAFPSWQDWPDGSHAVAALPLAVADGRVLGALALGYGDTHSWGDDERAVLRLLADAIAQAVDRARLRAAERRAADRLELLALASDVLSQSLDVSATLPALAELAVPRLGDWCAIHVLEEGRPRLMALAAVDADHLARAEAMLEASRVDAGQGVIGRCLLDGLPGLWQGWADEPIGAGLVVPLQAGGELVGALTVANFAERLMDATEVDLTEDLAQRAAVAVSKGRLFHQQRTIADALQRTLLPLAVPTFAGLDIGVAYEAAGGGQQLGGDFYDVMAVPGGVLVTIGDVRGRGVEAAALTGLARHTIRALGRLGLSPDAILRHLDGALRETAAPDDPESAFCTALTGRLQSQDDGILFTFASGGHPAPFLLRADAREVQRPSVRGDLLGVLPDVELLLTEIPLHPGDLLVLVTDGVLERRRSNEFFDDEGVAAAMLAHAEAPAAGLAGAIADAARAFAPEAASDDMAVVVVRISGD
jgi:serine phosphatase RsbU (regulator of sigma subunit)